MSERVLSATLPSVTTCYDDQRATFDSKLSFGSPVYGATCVGGEITFSRFRGFLSSYYFIIYINGQKACETVEINDQGQSAHTLTTYIDTEYGLKSDVLLQESGTIEVRVCDNTGSDYEVCSFRDDCVITIRASYFTPTVSINSFTVSQNTSGQYVVNWSATAYDGTGSVTYYLYYGSNETLVYSGTGKSATITIPSSYYGVSVPFKLVASYTNGAATDEVTKNYTAKHPSVSTPSGLKINGSSSYKGKTVPLTWSASSPQYQTGTVSYLILVNGTQVGETENTSYEIPEEVAKNYSSTVNITVLAVCNGYSSAESSSVSFQYDPGHSYVMVYAQGSFVPCVAYYFTQGDFVECIPYYHTNNDWIECSG